MTGEKGKEGNLLGGGGGVPAPEKFVWGGKSLPEQGLREGEREALSHRGEKKLWGGRDDTANLGGASCEWKTTKGKGAKQGSLLGGRK